MGLDMYLLARKVSDKPPQEREAERIGYWRKHADLHSFIETKWREAGCPQIDGNEPLPADADFNCVPFKLEKPLIEEIRRLSAEASLPTSPGGFFFGQSYPEDNADTIRHMDMALVYIEDGHEVFYDSWW